MSTNLANKEKDKAALRKINILHGLVRLYPKGTIKVSRPNTPSAENYTFLTELGTHYNLLAAKQLSKSKHVLKNHQGVQHRGYIISIGQVLFLVTHIQLQLSH